MATTAMQEILEQEIATLPETLAAEVYDFVMFLKDRHTEEDFLWRQVQAAQEHRREHPEEVITVTADEWDEMSG
jgi:hypothetical protein